MNEWQKIGPYPVTTNPSRSTVKNKKKVPPVYEWIPTNWSRVLLTRVVLVSYPEFETALDGDVLPWIEEGQTPTAALVDANERTAANQAQQRTTTKILDAIAETDYL